MVTVYVNSVQRDSVQGRHKQMYIVNDPRSNQEYKTQKNQHRVPGAADNYKFTYSVSKGEFLTGLDEIVLNDWFGLEDHVYPSNWIGESEIIKKQKEITLQTKYEILDNVPKGTYSSKPQNDLIFTWVSKMGAELPKSNSMTESFKITLYPDRVNIFRDDNSRGRLAIQLINNCPQIAPSKNEINPAIHRYYISSENESETERVNKADQINEAI